MLIKNLFIILSFILVAISRSEELYFYLMGTYSTINLDDYKKVREAYKYMRRLEEKLSTYIEDSEISLINKNSGKNWVKVSDDTLEVLIKAKEIAEKTYGYFDITVGSYTINYKRKKIIDEKKAKELINYKDLLIKGNKVLLKKEGMALDLGGIGKGYTIEKAYRYINTESGYISIGGDIKIWGTKRPIAVKNPLNDGYIAVFVNRTDVCISTSGNYIKEHIETEDTNIEQVTVLHKDCTYADAYATALFAMPDDMRKKFIEENKDVGVLILYKDGSTFVNETFLKFCERFKLLE